MRSRRPLLRVSLMKSRLQCSLGRVPMRTGCPRRDRYPLAFALWHGQSGCSIHAVDAFVIHHLTLPSQQGMQSPIAEARPLCGPALASVRRALRHLSVVAGSAPSSGKHQRADKHSVLRREKRVLQVAPPPRAWLPALPLFSQQLLEHLSLEGLVCHELLQPGILGFELLQTP